MESVCHGCGSLVEEQTSFCAVCGAPQIRVAARESQLPGPQIPTPPPPFPESPQAAAARLRVATPTRIDWRNFLRIAAPTAMLLGILGRLSPLSWLVLFPACIFLVIHLYKRRRPESLRAAQGVKMGIVIGLLTFSVLAIYIIGNVLLDPVAYRLAMESGLKEAMARNPDPEFAHLAALFSSTGGMVLLIVISMIMLLGFTLVVGAVCGALAAPLRRDRTP